MKKQTTFRKTIEKVWKNRAAIVIAIAATVFMCGLTALEFVALRMEWNLPVLAYVTGDSDSYIFEQIFMEMWDFERKSQDLIKEDSRDGLSRLEKELGQSVETTFAKGLLMKSAITRKFMTDVDTILESIS